MTLSTQEPQSDALVIKDSLDNTAGYISSEINYKNKIFQKGIDKIEKGIQLYPNRLDMRFGEIYVLGQVKDWNNFTKKIIQAIRYSVVNKNEWTWTNNEKKEDGENFFLGGLQDYQLQLYNTEDDKLLTNMADIATEVLKLYPNHVESLSNLSITYMLKNDFEKAIEVLLRAEKINPKDYIVLSNVAHAYKQKGDKLKAIEYYEKTVKYGDKNAIEDAKKQIEKLKK